MDTTHWEYHIQTFGSTLSSPKDNEFEAQLNEWGEEGWEIIAVTPIEGSCKVRVVARRPLSGPVRRQRRWPDPM